MQWVITDKETNKKFYGAVGPWPGYSLQPEAKLVYKFKTKKDTIDAIKQLQEHGLIKAKYAEPYKVEAL